MRLFQRAGVTQTHGSVLMHAPQDGQKISNMLGTHAQDSVAELSRRFGCESRRTHKVFLPPTQVGIRTDAAGNTTLLCGRSRPIQNWARFIYGLLGFEDKGMNLWKPCWITNWCTFYWGVHSTQNVHRRGFKRGLPKWFQASMAPLPNGKKPAQLSAIARFL